MFNRLEVLGVQGFVANDVYQKTSNFTAETSTNFSELLADILKTNKVIGPKEMRKIFFDGCFNIMLDGSH